MTKRETDLISVAIRSLLWILDYYNLGIGFFCHEEIER